MDWMLLQRESFLFTKARGQYQIILNHMEPAGIGALYQAFEETKKRLQAEGMFSDEKKIILAKISY